MRGKEGIKSQIERVQRKSNIEDSILRVAGARMGVGPLVLG